MRMIMMIYSGENWANSENLRKDEERKKRHKDDIWRQFTKQID